MLWEGKRCAGCEGMDIFVAFFSECGARPALRNFVDYYWAYLRVRKLPVVPIFPPNIPVPIMIFC